MARTDESELEAVVVTASRATATTKTDTALVETPQAISVITAEQFMDRSALTMQETLRYSAGVTSEAYGLDMRSDQPVVRGFYSVQYLDGMAKLFGYSLIPRAEVYTLERIELLRGPSSALYGKGNAGGVTNTVSKRPLSDYHSELGLQIGSHDRKQVQFDVTGPLDDAESFAGRVVGVARESEMQTDQISDDRLVLAPSFKWNASDRTTVTLLGLYQDDETASSQQFLPVAATLRAPPGRRVPDNTFLGEPQFDRLDTRQTLATLLVEHVFTDALELNSSVRYANARAAFNEIYPDVYSNPADPFIDADDRRVNRFAYVSREADEPNAWFVGMGVTANAPEPSAYYMFDARTGEFLHEYPLRQGVMWVLFRLHYDMYTGLPGTLFLGVMGLLLVASLVSGTVVYGPFMRKLKFGSVRHGRSSRIKWLDLHNLLGIATLIWLFTVGLTGVINTLALPIFGQWQATELADMTARYKDAPPLERLGSAERAVATARAALPKSELSFMAFPGNEFSTPHHYIAFMHGSTPLTSKLLTPILIDARTGELIDQRTLPWYVTALLISQPLHFGDYGGVPLKILWALLDLIAIIVLGSGVYLWIVKRNVPIETRLGALQTEGAA